MSTVPICTRLAVAYLLRALRRSSKRSISKACQNLSGPGPGPPRGRNKPSDGPNAVPLILVEDSRTKMRRRRKRRKRRKNKRRRRMRRRGRRKLMIMMVMLVKMMTGLPYCPQHMVLQIEKKDNLRKIPGLSMKNREGSAPNLQC